jgi:hypothetical protein
MKDGVDSAIRYGSGGNDSYAIRSECRIKIGDKAHDCGVQVNISAIDESADEHCFWNYATQFEYE